MPSELSEHALFVFLTKLHLLLVSKLYCVQKKTTSAVLFVLDFRTADGPREQAYIERSIRDIIENTKQQLEDSR
jgi:hypothetical protein